MSNNSGLSRSGSRRERVRASWNRVISSAFSIGDTPSSPSNPTTPSNPPMPLNPTTPSNLLTVPPTDRSLRRRSLPVAWTQTVVSSLSNLFRGLNHAVQDGWDLRYHSRYQEVRVLLVCWAEEDRSYRNAAVSLSRVLEDQYHVHTEILQISALDPPQKTLTDKLKEFVQRYGRTSDNLLVFWYGGAAKLDEPDVSGNRPVMWTGENFGGGELDSAVVPQILGSDSCKADVLTMYDCPYSLHMRHAVLGDRVYEHLGASAGGADIPAFPRIGSFSRSLVELLAQEDHAKFGLPVLDLHRKLVNIARTSSNSVGQYFTDVASEETREGSNPDSSDSMASPPPPDLSSVWSSVIPLAPVYCHLSSCPRLSKNQHVTITLARQGDYPLETFRNSNAISRQTDGEVKIKLTLRDNDIDRERWRQWLMKAPSEVGNLSIQTA